MALSPPKLTLPASRGDYGDAEHGDADGTGMLTPERVARLARRAQRRRANGSRGWLASRALHRLAAELHLKAVFGVWLECLDDETWALAAAGGLDLVRIVAGAPGQRRPLASLTPADARVVTHALQVTDVDSPAWLLVDLLGAWLNYRFGAEVSLGAPGPLCAAADDVAIAELR